MFITIYGINNIGKSTQAKRIVEKLRDCGKQAIFIKYPAYEVEPTGGLINRVLRSGGKQKMSEEELQMWFTLNRYQFEPKLKKMLSSGKIVVAEDYIGTALAWGLVKGADLKWLIEINKYLRREDLAILLDGSRKMSAKERKHLHEKDDKLVDKCRSVYLNLAKKFGWKVVKVSDVWDVTTARIWEVIRKELGIKD